MTTFLDHIRKAMTFATPEPSPVRVWLPDAYGAAVYDAQISKGAGHKYIKRVPVGTTKGGATRYRYYYEVQHGSGVHNEEHFVEGAAFKHDGGHFHVKAVDGDTLTIVHDETGQSKKVSRKALVEMLQEHHGKALDAHKAKVAADLAATERHGSAKQKVRMRAHAAKWGVGDDEDDAGFRETMREQGERMRDADAPRPRAKATKPDPTDAESLRSAVASEWPILRHATAETLQHFRTIPSVRGAIGKWDDATVLSAVGEMGATAKASATPPQPKPEAKGAAAANDTPPAAVPPWAMSKDDYMRAAGGDPLASRMEWETAAGYAVNHGAQGVKREDVHDDAHTKAAWQDSDARIASGRLASAMKAVHSAANPPTHGRRERAASANGVAAKLRDVEREALAKFGHMLPTPDDPKVKGVWAGLLREVGAKGHGGTPISRVAEAARERARDAEILEGLKTGDRAASGRAARRAEELVPGVNGWGVSHVISRQVSHGEMDREFVDGLRAKGWVDSKVRMRAHAAKWGVGGKGEAKAATKDHPAGTHEAGHQKVAKELVEASKRSSLTPNPGDVLDERNKAFAAVANGSKTLASIEAEIAGGNLPASKERGLKSAVQKIGGMWDQTDESQKLKADQRRKDVNAAHSAKVDPHVADKALVDGWHRNDRAAVVAVHKRAQELFPGIRPQESLEVVSQHVYGGGITDEFREQMRREGRTSAPREADGKPAPAPAPTPPQPKPEAKGSPGRPLQRGDLPRSGGSDGAATSSGDALSDRQRDQVHDRRHTRAAAEGLLDAYNTARTKHFADGASVEVGKDVSADGQSGVVESVGRGAVKVRLNSTGRVVSVPRGSLGLPIDEASRHALAGMTDAGLRDALRGMSNERWESDINEEIARRSGGAPLKKSRGFATLIKSYIEARR